MPKEKKTLYTILGLLNIGEMSGYQMKQAIEKYFIYFWKESWGQIYPALKKLEEDKCVVVREVNDGRKTKIYTITDRGRVLFSEYQKRKPDNMVLRSELLLKLFLGGDTDNSVLLKHLESELHNREEIIYTQSQFAIETPESCSHEDSTVTNWKYTLKFGEMYNMMIKNWCQYVINDIKKENR